MEITQLCQRYLNAFYELSHHQTNRRSEDISCLLIILTYFTAVIPLVVAMTPMHNKTKYILVHAAMINSGARKIRYKIDHVIVVAGHQGETTAIKENQLYSCYYNSLILAHSRNISRIAFPLSSTGIFCFSKKCCCDFFKSNL